MPYAAPITGYVDSLGYLRCVDCAEDRHKDFAVDGDNSAFHDQLCECCGWSFPWIKTRDYVRIDWNQAPPEYKKPQPRKLWAAE